MAKREIKLSKTINIGKHVDVIGFDINYIYHHDNNLIVYLNPGSIPSIAIDFSNLTKAEMKVVDSFQKLIEDKCLEYLNPPEVVVVTE